MSEGDADLLDLDLDLDLDLRSACGLYSKKPSVLELDIGKQIT